MTGRSSGRRARRSGRFAPLLLIAGLGCSAASEPLRASTRTNAEASPLEIAVRLEAPELSGVARVPGGLLIAEDELVGGLLFVSDAAGSPARFTAFQRGRKKSRPFSKKRRLLGVQDVEGLASDGASSLFAVGSHHPHRTGDRSPDREFLLQLEWKDHELEIERIVPSLLPAIAAGLSEAGTPTQLDDTSMRPRLNLEGLAYDPAGDRLFVGLRSPLSASGAAYIAVFDRAEVFESDGALPPVLLTLELGGGVRGLGWDAARGALLVVAGPSDDAGGPSALYRADPTTRAVALLHRFSEREIARWGRPEGVVADGDALVLAFDGESGGGLLLRMPR